MPRGGGPHVYDKADYHYETIREEGLPDEHAGNHIVLFLRWLIENGLVSELFVTEGAEPLARWRAGELGIHGLFEWWDEVLVSDMLSDEGNAFAMRYFDYDNGKYLEDLRQTLQGALPSEFHIAYSDENYAKLRPVIDRRYANWKLRKDEPEPTPTKSRWRFWK